MNENIIPIEHWDQKIQQRLKALVSRKSAQTVFDLLGKKHVRLVAGAVRDSLLDRPIHDIDMATSLPAEEVLEIAKKADIRAIPTGLQHGTVTLICDNEPVEITTLRQDLETDGRHAKVVFTDSWEQDALRRDFTINAFFLDADLCLYDYTHGLDALKQKKLCFIGEASQRICEDYLRILRFFRFISQLGFSPSHEDLWAISCHLQGLDRLSRERIGAEWQKLILGVHSRRSLYYMKCYGVMLKTLPLVPNYQAYDNFQVLIKDEDIPFDFSIPIYAIGVLWLSSYGDSKRLQSMLKLSNQEVKVLSACVNEKIWPALNSENQVNWQEKVYRYGKQAVALRLIYLWAKQLLCFTQEQLIALLQQIEKWCIPVVPFKAQDLISQGIQPGKALGEKLKLLEEEWIASGFEG